MANTDVILKGDSEVTETLPAGFALGDESMAVSLTRAEIDTQISTARRFPRSMSKARDNIMSLATMDEKAAAECTYALPRGGKPIKGPTIRFAEIIFQCWGNARCDARVIAVDRVEKVVIAEGTYHDLETNAAGRSVVRRRISHADGRIFNDDMITVTGNAACSIAKRNAIIAGVPKAIWGRAHEVAQETALGKVTTLSEAREQALKAFGGFGVKPEQVYAVLEIGGYDDIKLDHIGMMRRMFGALKDGETTVEDMFSNARKVPSTHEKVDNPLSDEGDAVAEEATPAHDPETGEILPADVVTAAGTVMRDAPQGETVSAEGRTPQEPAQSPEKGAGQVEGAVVAGPAPTQDKGADALLERGRAAAMKGARAFKRWHGGLTLAQLAIIKPHEAQLQTAANSVDETTTTQGEDR